MSNADIGDKYPKSKLSQRYWYNQFGSGTIEVVRPYGIPEDAPLIPGETPEQRAFRRFPITSHKPGP